MTEFSLTLLTASMALCAVAIVSLATLKGWRDWIALRRHELDGMMQGRDACPSDMAISGSRIEIADLRERVRQLEAIAAGVDL
ncbi:MAG: hypothetical protein IT553_06250 [Sphingomonadaceae bacterium]|nr:hypothetical protein [Sphingomonadaceae bacterium]